MNDIIVPCMGCIFGFGVGVCRGSDGAHMGIVDVDECCRLVSMVG